jgi:hypothetical protein
MIIHQIDGIVKKMFANLKEIGGSIEAMCPAMEAGPVVAKSYAAARPPASGLPSSLWPASPGQDVAASPKPLRSSAFFIEKTVALILGLPFLFLLMTLFKLFQTESIAVGRNNTVIWVFGIPNRSKGIMTAWSFVRPAGNETETGISPEIAPSPAHRMHS